MPRRLLDRCQPDCIRQFRAAASQRFDDGPSLAAAGRRTAAIYLWGYTAEMTLKAAYFGFLGFADTDNILWRHHLEPAIDRGRKMGIAWPRQGAGHNVRAWAELLVAARAASAATALPTSLGLEVQNRGQRIGALWCETLRYRRNHAYLYEVRQVREAAEWFLVNSDIF